MTAALNLRRRARRWFRLQVYRRGRVRGLTRNLRNLLTFIGAGYALFFTLLTLFSAFWTVALLYTQLQNPKIKTLSVFPGGLTDAGTLVPLALLAFSALLFAAQQSVPPGRPLRALYGYAARCLMNAFYFLAMSFVLGLGSRIIPPHSFDRLHGLGGLFNRLALLTPGFMYLSGLIAGLFALAGLVRFSCSFAYRGE